MSDRNIAELLAFVAMFANNQIPEGPRRFSRATTKKPGGRPRGSLSAASRRIRGEVLALQDEYDVMTVRQVFYALTVRGIVEKTEAGYRQVQRHVLLMRREGVLPWEFIADGTRWVHAPETWDSIDDAIRETARTYRRNLWRSQAVRLEFWLEKDALASIVSEVTFPWGVRLMVSRGQASDTYCYSAARDAETAWTRAGVSTHVYTLYDADRSGRIAAEKVAQKLRRHAGSAPIVVTALAVTDEQITGWNLPTRPAKENKNEVAVELDAIPPDRLKTLVEEAIRSHIDPDAWRMEQAAEASEREIGERIVGGSG